MSKYTITSTTRTTYFDDMTGKTVNGVLVTFRMDDYNERGEVRAPEMNAASVKAAIEKYVSERDQLAGKK